MGLVMTEKVAQLQLSAACPTRLWLLLQRQGLVGGELGGKSASRRTWTYCLHSTLTSRLVGIGGLDVDLKLSPFQVHL